VSTMENTEKEVRPSIVQQGKTRKIKQPGRGKQIRIALLVILIIGALMGGGWKFLSPSEEIYVLKDYESALVNLGSFESTIQASGTVQIGRSVDIPNRQEGYGDELYVDEGDMIKAGQILARLDVPDLEEELEDNQLSLASLQINLEEVIIRQKYEIINLNSEIEDLNDEIVDAREEVDKYAELIKVNASRKSEWDTAKDNLENKEAALTDAQLNLDQQEQLNALEIRSLKEQINQLNIKIARTMAEIEDTRITSPIDGEVQSIADQLAVAGSFISQNDTLFTIVDRDSAMVDLEVYEEYSPLLYEGQDILMTISDRAVWGTIDSIGQYANASSDGLGSTVTVEIIPDQTGGYLTPGATVVADISLGQRENVMTLPRDSFLTTGSQKYLYVIKDGMAQKVKVTYGAIEDDTVEILTGVEPGDEIIISGYQNFIEYGTLKIEE
jgi:HlyD family secretion protein